MFGYVAAAEASLTDAQRQRYRSCYCGLCRCIGQQYGAAQRIALNYDMTFLILLLSSLYEPEETHENIRCLIHPMEGHAAWSSDVTEYAAAMNMILAYYNCMDDWHDDKSLRAALQMKFFRRAASQAGAQYPLQASAIKTCIEQLSSYEKNNVHDPDLCANTFGSLMGQLFIWKEDRWSDTLQQMGAALGRFIYLVDAVIDLKKDQQNGSYNPLLFRSINDSDQSSFYPVLKLLIGECTEAFECLPLVQDIDLLRNILYSGVWVRYNQAVQIAQKENAHV